MDFRNYLKLVNNCHDNAPLLSDTPLGECLSFVPLRQVAPSDLLQLTESLNVEQLIRTDKGLARDCRGLAELMGFSSIELETHFKRSNNPTKSLIDAYVGKLSAASLQHGTPGAAKVVSLNDLLIFLEKLARFDIIDDFLPKLVMIANESQKKTCSTNKQLINGHCRVVAATDRQGDQHIDAAPESETIDTHGPDETATSVQQYDAIVCYAPEDSDHAMGLIRMLVQNNKNIVTPDDILPGQLKYNALVQMIAEKCNKVILILTPNFIRSKDCDFQAKFAFEIAIKSAHSTKVIPILFEQIDDSELPPLLRVISKIDMTLRNARQHEWQLRKLLGSLNTPRHPSIGPQFSKSVAFHDPQTSHAPLAITLNDSELSISRENDNRQFSERHNIANLSGSPRSSTSSDQRY